MGHASHYRISESALLDAACAEFAAEGFESTTMDRIAARAGTTKPTLYARFGSKQDLFEAAVRREYELLLAHLSAAYELELDEPFRARVKRWTTAYFEFARDRPEGVRLSIEGERHTTAAAIIQQTNERIISRIAELVERTSGRRLGPGARLVAASIAGMLTWCAREAVDACDIDLTQAAALCESLLYTMLRDADLELIAAIEPR
jgi:AcrR family transcriptional regulator